MSHVECIDVIHAVEADIDVSAARYADFELWPIVRMMIGLSFKSGVSGGTSNPLRRLRTMASLHAMPPRPPKSRVDSLVLTQRSIRYESEPGGFWDPMVATLDEAHRANGWAFEAWDWSDVPERRSPLQEIRPIDLDLAVATARALIRQHMGRRQEGRRNGMEQLVAAVGRAGVVLDVERAVTRAVQVDLIGSTLQRRLEGRRPRLALVVCFYGLPGLGFTLGCRRAGVYTVDVQHGVQGPGHAVYGRWADPSGHSYALHPDAFWCWRVEDAAWIDEAFGAGRAVVGGNPFLGCDPPSHSQPVPPARPPASREILVTLQPGVGLPDGLSDALADAPADWRWWLRPHPLMSTEDVKNLLGTQPHGRVEVEAAARLPLASLLRVVDVHVTSYSSVVIEAEDLGVPSIVTWPGADRFFADQLNSGHAFWARGGVDLIARITAARRYPPRSTGTATVEALKTLRERAGD